MPEAAHPALPMLQARCCVIWANLDDAPFRLFCAFACASASMLEWKAPPSCSFCIDSTPVGTVGPLGLRQTTTLVVLGLGRAFLCLSVFQTYPSGARRAPRAPTDERADDCAASVVQRLAVLGGRGAPGAGRSGAWYA